MDKTKILLGITAIVIVVSVYRAVSTHCRRAPAWRPWLIAASIAALGVVPLLVPWVNQLSPSLRESPGGLLVILPKAAAVSLIALSAIGTLLGAIFPGRSGQTD